MGKGSFLGFRVIINDYFILLLLGYALLGVFPQTVILFSLVLIHEMAHLLMAARLGIQAKEIELFPFGGVARVEEMLETSPQVEIPVALAGPMVNLILFTLAYFFWPELGQGPLGKLFLQGNLMLGLFNFLPALPLDGGRILRSLLSKKIGFYKATGLILKLSKAIGVGVGLWGLLGLYLGVSNLHTFFMGIFLYGVALKEEKNFLYLFLRYLLRKGDELKSQGILPLRQFITTKNITLGEVAGRFTPGHYHLVLLPEKGGREFVSLTEHQIVTALLEYGRSYPIGRLIP